MHSYVSLCVYTVQPSRLSRLYNCLCVHSVGVSDRVCAHVSRSVCTPYKRLDCLDCTTVSVYIQSVCLTVCVRSCVSLCVYTVQTSRLSRLYNCLCVHSVGVSDRVCAHVSRSVCTPYNRLDCLDCTTVSVHSVGVSDRVCAHVSSSVCTLCLDCTTVCAPSVSHLSIVCTTWCSLSQL